MTCDFRYISRYAAGIFLVGLISLFSNREACAWETPSQDIFFGRCYLEECSLLKITSNESISSNELGELRKIAYKVEIVDESQKNLQQDDKKWINQKQETAHVFCSLIVPSVFSNSQEDSLSRLTLFRLSTEEISTIDYDKFALYLKTCHDLKLQNGIQKKLLTQYKYKTDLNQIELLQKKFIDVKDYKIFEEEFSSKRNLSTVNESIKNSNICIKQPEIIDATNIGNDPSVCLGYMVSLSPLVKQTIPNSDKLRELFSVFSKMCPTSRGTGDLYQKGFDDGIGNMAMLAKGLFKKEHLVERLNNCGKVVAFYVEILGKLNR